VRLPVQELARRKSMVRDVFASDAELGEGFLSFVQEGFLAFVRDERQDH
jgi:hypothetical protein